MTDLSQRIANLDKRIAKLATDRDDLLRKKAEASGWKPCDDCFNGYCSMNCSSAPIYMQVLV